MNHIRVTFSVVQPKGRFINLSLTLLSAVNVAVASRYVPKVCLYHPLTLPLKVSTPRYFNQSNCGTVQCCQLEGKSPEVEGTFFWLTALIPPKSNFDRGDEVH